MNFQLQSSPFKLQLSVLVERDASCLDPLQEQHGLMQAHFDVLCAAQHTGAELRGADLIRLLKSNLEPGL